MFVTIPFLVLMFGWCSEGQLDESQKANIVIGFKEVELIEWQDFHTWIKGDELAHLLKEIRNLGLHDQPHEIGNYGYGSGVRVHD